MERVRLLGGSWFNASSAYIVRGLPVVRKATRIQEFLYITRSGRYILHIWTTDKLDFDVYLEVSEERAAHWLFLNRVNPDDVLPTTLQRALRRLYDRLQA